MRLTEEQTRAKVIELYEGCDHNRMNVWIFSGLAAGVLDADLVERIMNEEIWRRSHEVRRFWLGGCNCHGQLN